jgi:nitrogen regulatory protein PII
MSAKHPPTIKLLFFIIDWNKARVVSKVFEQENVQFYFFSQGKGTANSEVLDMLGIGSTDKAVILCLEHEKMAPVLVKEVRQKLGAQSRGAGIAFTVPLSAINQPILQALKESIHPNFPPPKPADKDIKKMSDIKNDLIISIINQGYSDEFMTVAKEAGARGGTVIAARGLTSNKPVKFFGVSIQDEKEIVLIMTGRESKTAIMEALSKAYGVNSQADGVIFSLPVESVMSLNAE